MSVTAGGELALVLHTHMPYVEGGGSWPDPRNPPAGERWLGFGTWPFGEEWLWEAIATSYLPLLDLLDELGEQVAGRLTLSLTPVLADQLLAPGAPERCLRFLREVRAESHRLDAEQYAADPALSAALERSAAAYADAADRLEQRIAAPGGLLGAFARHASWTSSATHAVLPLLCLDEAVELQLAAGVESHRRRFGDWRGGLWLPECAYAAWLDPHLTEVGVRHTCVEVPGDPSTPYRSATGTVLWPIDRAVVDLVWADDGYPASPGYRSYHGLTPRHHRLWSIDGAVYDPARAGALARRHAAEFVADVRRRVAGGGICVCALDTELLGHWFHEGVAWLRAVIEQADHQGLPLTVPDDAAAERHPPQPLGDRGTRPSSWGLGRDLRTWSEPPAAELAKLARSAELDAFAGGLPSPRALRELLALQSSDWAFLAYRGWVGDYPWERARGHREALAAACRGELTEPSLRNLAPYL